MYTHLFVVHSVCIVSLGVDEDATALGLKMSWYTVLDEYFKALLEESSEEFLEQFLDKSFHLFSIESSEQFVNESSEKFIVKEIMGEMF